jgi:hypothetical protein
MYDIGGGFRNLFFNLVLHEFEGLLFADISAFQGIADNGAIADLQEIKNSFPTPEHINDSPDTAPSKRIENIIPTYKKKLDGISIAKSIGVDGISAECRHFENWIAKLTAWAREGV